MLGQIYLWLNFIQAHTAEVIGLINQLSDKGVRVILTKQNSDISKHNMASKIIVTLFSLYTDLERDLIGIC